MRPRVLTGLPEADVSQLPLLFFIPGTALLFFSQIAALCASPGFRTNHYAAYACQGKIIQGMYGE
jgi:hypothetical protein